MLSKFRQFPLNRGKRSIECSVCLPKISDIRQENSSLFEEDPTTYLIESNPEVSDQGVRKSCYAHSTGKCLVKILDRYGFDCSQEAIISDLEAKQDSLGEQGRHIGAFNNMRVLVKIW